MKVMIGDTLYDASEVPICIILSEADKQNICNMHDEYYRYAVYPEGAFPLIEDLKEWMGSVADKPTGG